MSIQTVEHSPVRFCPSCVYLYHGTQGQKWDVLVYHRYSCPSHLFVPWDTRTEVGCVPQIRLCTLSVHPLVPQILLCTPVHPTYLYHGTQGQKWDLLVYHIRILLCIPVHPTYSYHGKKGQKWDVLVYHRYCCVLLSVPSTCTTGHKDRSGMY